MDVDNNNYATAPSDATALTVAEEGADEGKCCFRHCKVRGSLIHNCAANGCNREIHLACYQGAVLVKIKLVALSGNRVVCAKKCYDRVMKVSITDDSSRKGDWDSDGKNGPGNPNTSMNVLIKWWMEESNYSRFCGKNNDGMKKIHFCQTLADTMNEATNSNRDAKSVLSKIQHVEKKWREAHNFATSEIGAGAEESQGVESFQEAVKKTCQHHCALMEAMQDRASSRPKATSCEIEGLNQDDTENLDIPEDQDEEDNVSGLSNNDRGSVVTNKTSASKRTSAASTGSKKKKPKSSGAATVATASSLLDEEALARLDEANSSAANRLNKLERHKKH